MKWHSSVSKVINYKLEYGESIPGTDTIFFPRPALGPTYIYTKLVRGQMLKKSVSSELLGHQVGS
jgi:hypothetical protein